MWPARPPTHTFRLALAAALLVSGARGLAQEGPATRTLPNPYRLDEGWAKLPEGRTWGATIGDDMDRDGKSVWVFERCGTAGRLLGLEPRADHEIRGVEAVRTAERPVHRQAGPPLRGRLGVDLCEQSGLHAGRPRRDGQGRQGR